MPYNFFCPFCGVILRSDPYRDDDPSASSEVRVRPWYAEARGIYLDTATVDCIAMTGLGVVRSGRLCAPLGRDLSYVDIGVEALKKWELYQPLENCGCFAFHVSCWKLLLPRLGCDQAGHFPDESVIAESVFYLLYCTPSLHGSSFQFGHDYEGAARTHKRFGRPKSVPSGSHFYADPCAIPSMDELENYHKESSACGSGFAGTDDDRPAVPLPCGTRRESRRTLETPHIFDGLSLELQYEILSYLPFAELLNMRLVCRDLALFTAPDMFPQSYWRSRFLLGQEADFLFPNLTATRDWSGLYFGTRAALRDGLLPLINRRRIRQLLEPIAVLVEIRSHFEKGPSGSAAQPVKGQGGCFQLIDGKELPRLLQVTGSFSGRTSTGADTPLREGCRVLYYRTQSFSLLHWQNRQRIGISFVRIGSRSFISGISLLSPGDCSIAGRWVGYHNPASEQWIETPSTSHVKGLCVAFRAEGLVGVRFLFTQSDPSRWVGDDCGPGIATGTLNISEKSNASFLLAGLDRFKVVSLGHGELVDHSGASLKTPSQDWSRVQSHLWTPHPPSHEELTISPLLPAQSPRAFEQLTNIDFGGPRGLLLGSLSRLALHMVSFRCPIIGIEIFFDGRSVLFGSEGGCVLSFFVNGPAGERINTVSILEDNREYYASRSLGGLQVSTNYGRTATFAPLCYRLNATVGPIPIVPAENTITGLIAVDPKCQNRFDKVGIQSQPCEEQLIEPDILDCECHQVPDDQIRYDEKFSHFIDSSSPGSYQTYASLKNVRMIQASTGMRGRSRSSNRICGLKFQYYNHPSPGTVGQWMNELDEDAFELSPDEEVRSLTIWLTSMGFSRQTPGRELGQVVAIRIETTHSRSVTFRTPDFHTLPTRTLQHQFQSGADEKLTAISWIMNESYECVRAVTSPEKNGKFQVLIPEREAPFDQVRKLYFERQNTNGSREGIVTAEAYFRDEAIVGLVFIYASGARTGIGELETDTHQQIQFERHERIVGMSAGALGHSLMEIGFEVGQDEPRYKTLGPPTTSPADGDPYDGYDWRDVWRRDGSSADYHSLAGGGSVYDPPSESRLVGIYVGCQDFCDVGAVYEPV